MISIPKVMSIKRVSSSGYGQQQIHVLYSPEVVEMRKEVHLAGFTPFLKARNVGSSDDLGYGDKIAGCTKPLLIAGPMICTFFM